MSRIEVLINKFLILIFIAVKKDSSSKDSGSSGGKTAEPVCDKFTPQTFKPLFCANCFNAKADHQTTSTSNFICLIFDI